MFLRKTNEVKKPIMHGVARVPIVMQMENLECGAAALTMVMAYYGKWVPLEQVREDCDVSRDGSKAGNIARAARNYGFLAKGYRFEADFLKKNGQFPCIIHWNFNHFVVLKGFKGGKVYINDPARGDVIVTEEEYDESFTGVCIMFEPGEDFHPSGKPKSMIEFARRRLEGTKNASLFVVLTTSIAALTTLLAAVFSRFFMDYLLSGNNSRYFWGFMLFFSILTLIQIVIAWLQAIYSLRIRGKFAAIGNTSYFWHVLQLPMKFFSQRMAGDIEKRRMANADIVDLLVNTVAPLVINTGMMIFYLVFMIRYSVWMTLVGVLSVFVNVYVARYVSLKRVNITRVMMRDEAKLSSTTVSGIEMIETIKVSGAENGFFSRWADYQASANAQYVRLDKLNAYYGKITEAVVELLNDAILLIGVYFIIKGEFTSGMILAFQGFLAQFISPAHVLINAGQSLQEMRTKMERIDDVMEYPKDAIYAAETSLESDETDDEGEDETGKIKQNKLTGNLELKNVSFGYSKFSPPLIDNFNLSLKHGKSVAIVGPSGCGKSTISRLISGLYQPWDGEILYDGKHIQDIDREVFTGSVAVVNQEIILFEDSISENIKMWDSSIEDFEVILAARDARIHEDIMQRTGGYQYKLNEGGTDFSGGQRQRMEIARVLAADPTVVILDEATSSLDAQTEFEVVQAIRERGITCIVVAHRLSTIRDCDEIIVLDHGKVVERGTHDDLMARNGAYTRLVINE